MITCSSPTGAGIRTRSCATTGRPSPNCSAAPPNAGWSSRAWGGARIWTSSPTARRRIGISATRSRRPAARCYWINAFASAGRIIRSWSSSVTRRPPNTTWRSPAASTCVTRDATTTRIAAIGKRCGWPSATASTRRGTTCNCGCRALSWAPSTPRSGNAGMTRLRWTCCPRSPGSRTSCAAPT